MHAEESDAVAESLVVHCSSCKSVVHGALDLTMSEGSSIVDESKGVLSEVKLCKASTGRFDNGKDGPLASVRVHPTRTNLEPWTGKFWDTYEEVQGVWMDRML